METYIAAKMTIFARMDASDWAVLGRGQPWWRDRVPAMAPRLTTFGADAPASGECGIVYDSKRRELRAEDGWRVAPTGAWPRHPFDWDNLAAAAEMAHRFGVSEQAVGRAVAAFEPLAHRLHLVGTHRGVEFWDDSKATNVGATLVSLEAFSQPVILLAGGVAKGADFDALSRAKGIKQILAYGEAGPELAGALDGAWPVRVHVGMREAFADAATVAEPGDVVLLAPACASFDEFTNYAHRGDVFASLVEALGT
jgi:UDP-N-acetylmuramoylalanine--D-glutamate ligase